MTAKQRSKTSIPFLSTSARTCPAILRGVSVQRIAGAGNNDTRVLVRQGPLMALNAQTGCNFPAQSIQIGRDTKLRRSILALGASDNTHAVDT